MPLTFWASALTARPQRQLSSHTLITHPSDSNVSATAAIYILGETHTAPSPVKATILHVPVTIYTRPKFLLVLKMFIVTENKSYNLLF